MVFPDEALFLHPRPVRDLWGVGPKTAERLARYGVNTIGDLAALKPDALERLVGRAAGQHLHALSWARDERAVQSGVELKSVGHEETFPTDRHDHGLLQPEVVRLADSVGARLRSARLTGRTVNLKLRFADFSTITRVSVAQRPAPQLGRDRADRHGAPRGSRRRSRRPAARRERLVASSHSGRLVAPALVDGPERAVGRACGGTPVGAATPPSLPAPRWRRRSTPSVLVTGPAVVGPATVVERGAGLRVKQLGDGQWG